MRGRLLPLSRKPRLRLDLHLKTKLFERSKKNMDFSSSNKRNQRGKGIVKVSDLFAKYKAVLKAPQGVVVTAFQEVIFEVLGVRIAKEHCTYSVGSKTLSVRAAGMIKSEIKLQKKLILSKMAEKLGAKSAPKEIL